MSRKVKGYNIDHRGGCFTLYHADGTTSTVTMEDVIDAYIMTFTEGYTKEEYDNV